ncbi:hypothetical protein VNO77_10607 [Canavalia gladiata]|uniref:Uncharacterized protein n=1 Tax=Canavalia gladiata TaxID=3824 RepID=A0AAN9MB44_CANGL
MAASMAIITALCSFRFRRKTAPETTETDNDLDAPQSITVADAEQNDDNNEGQGKELPLPPAMQVMQQPKDPFVSNNLKRVTSERKASFSLSIKMPRSLSVRHHKEDKIKGKLKPEDSVWMKTIILGEKCVPDEEADAVIYEGKGKRISAYHTKRHSSISVSAQPAFPDHDAFPSAVPQTQTQTQDEKINNT